jgi:hypothetical protein
MARPDRQVLTISGRPVCFQQISTADYNAAMVCCGMSQAYAQGLVDTV